MQLILTNLFRPKWQHPKPAVRKQAVNNLDPHQDNDQAILEQIAREDRDSEIRCQALLKLNNADCVEQLSRDGDRAVSQSALNRLCELTAGQGETDLPLQRRLSLLERLNTTDHLLHIALKGDCFEIRQEALLRIEEQSALARIVTSADQRPLRQLAAEAIREPELLHSLIREVRQRDKSVYRILKQRLDQQRDAAQQQAAHHAAQLQLCQALEKLAEEAVAQHYHAKLQGLVLQWDSLAAAPQAPFTTRFDKARAQCQLKAERYAEELAARQQQAAIQAQQEQLVAALGASLEQLDRLATPAQLAELTAPDSWQQRWQQLNGERAPAAALAQQFERSLAALVQRLAPWQRLAALADTLQQCDDPSVLAERLKQLNWPAGQPQPELLKQSRQRLKAISPAPSEAAPVRCDAELEQLQQALEQGQLNPASELIRQLRDQQHLLRGAARSQFTRLNARYQELQDWQQYATRPKLEALCDAMAALAEDQDSALAARAARLRALQQQWKELDSPQIPHALRKQYQKANDQAYQQCRDYFDQQRQERQQNLIQRERLCEQLDHLLQDQTEPADLKALASANRQLRSEWRRYSPVERGPGKKLQKRFNRALERLEARLDEARQANAARKLALTEQAEALLSGGDPDQASAAARELQQQWKSVGAAGREQDQTLWQRFNQACSSVQRDAKAARADQEAQARQAATTLCQQLEQATDRLEPSLSRLQQQFDQQLGELSDGRRLQQRFAEALNQYQLRCHPQEADWPALQTIEQQCRTLEKALLGGQAADPALLDQLPLDALAAEIRPQLSARIDTLRQLCRSPERLEERLADSDQALRLLCIRREILCGEPSPDEDQALRMEYQMARLQDALQRDDSQPTCVRSLLTLQREWLGVPFNSFFEELNPRFHASKPNR